MSTILAFLLGMFSAPAVVPASGGTPIELPPPVTGG